MDTENLKHEAEEELSRFSSVVLSMRWSSLIIVYVGMLMVNQFFAQMAHGRFGKVGFEAYVDGLLESANVGSLFEDFMIYLANNGQIYGPILGAFTLITGLACMLLIGRSIAALAVSLFFWVLWYATSATSGIWTFEFYFPAIFALIGGLATLPQFAASGSRERWLGAKTLGEVSHRFWLIFSVAISVVLAWFFTMAESGGEDYLAVSIVSGVAFAVLLLITGRMDQSRQVMVPQPTGRMMTLSRAPWMSIAVIAIGMMMTIQVFADIAVDWFTVDGYRSFVQSYADDTGAPGWWSAFLGFVADNAEIFMPLQAVAEFACGFFLVTLLIRPLTLFATFGFFFTLMFSEFGVSATIKQGSDKTWEWEMMMVTGVLLMLAIVHLARVGQQKTMRERVLGDKLFMATPIGLQVVIWIAATAWLYFLGIQTRMFGSEYATTSLRGAGYFAVCFLVLIIIDRMRPQPEWSLRTDRVWAS